MLGSERLCKKQAVQELEHEALLARDPPPLAGKGGVRGGLCLRSCAHLPSSERDPFTVSEDSIFSQALSTQDPILARYASAAICLIASTVRMTPTTTITAEVQI